MRALMADKRKGKIMRRKVPNMLKCKDYSGGQRSQNNGARVVEGMVDEKQPFRAYYDWPWNA